MKHILIILIIGSCSIGCRTEHGEESKRPLVKEDQPTALAPRNVDQAIKLLKVKLTDGEIDEIKVKQESQMVGYHYSIGLWIRNNWLCKESPLKIYFNQQGIYERDTMSGIILVSLWRSLHGLPAKVEEQIAHYKITHPNEK